MQKIYQKIILVGVVIMLSGCGFKMRTATDLPPQLKNMYVQTNAPYSKFTTDLKHTLKASGINLQPNVKDADTTLVINSTSFTNSTADATLTAQARVYSFTFAATITLKTLNDQIILPTKIISSSRNLTLNPNEILSASNQVNTAKTELQRNVIGQIIYQLEAKQTRDNLDKLTKRHTFVIPNS